MSDQPQIVSRFCRYQIARSASPEQTAYQLSKFEYNTWSFAPTNASVSYKTCFLGRSLLLDPVQLTELFSSVECERIVAIAHAGIFRDSELIGSTRSDAVRLAQTSWLDEEGTAKWIFNRLLEAFAQSNREHFDFKLDEFAERMQVAWYGAEAGAFFDWHSDVGTSSVASRRKLTMVVQLSEAKSYLGGQLETNADGHIRAASRCIGSALVIPSFMLHRVRPVSHGSRYSLTLWSHGPAFQ
ncbi:MAG: 2OG-Fe(II) oxygenase [Hyphomicrobiaceae bacterium]